MFNAKVYKIAVLSLSGIMEEVYAAKQTIQQWMSSISNSFHQLPVILLATVKHTNKVAA